MGNCTKIRLKKTKDIMISKISELKLYNQQNKKKEMSHEVFQHRSKSHHLKHFLD
jgi:hypothetical protein